LKYSSNKNRIKALQQNLQMLEQKKQGHVCIIRGGT